MMGAMLQMDTINFHMLNRMQYNYSGVNIKILKSIPI